MKLLLTLFSISICVSAFAQKIINFTGLQEEVEIMIDPFGVPHIYAKNENDMFLLKGFNLQRTDYFNLKCGEGKLEVFYRIYLVKENYKKISPPDFFPIGETQWLNSIITIQMVIK